SGQAVLTKKFRRPVKTASALGSCALSCVEKSRMRTRRTAARGCVMVIQSGSRFAHVGRRRTALTLHRGWRARNGDGGLIMFGPFSFCKLLEFQRRPGIIVA